MIDFTQDYIDLFNYKRKGHMAKYVHMYKPDIYDKALLEDTYYPFKMECDLIKLKADQIIKDLHDVTVVVEIGPGSSSPIKLKTIPFLKALTLNAPSFSTYKALDSNLIYAQQACRVIQDNFPRIKTEAIEINLVINNILKNLKVIRSVKGKTLFLGFGQCIFPNHNNEEIEIFLKNLGLLLRKDDYLIFGIDTNKDKSMLEQAYNTKLVHEMLLNTMYYLKNELNLQNFDPSKFDSVYCWNDKDFAVEHYLKSTKQQIIKISNFNFVINKNDKFNILNSRKREISQIEKLLKEENFKILNIFKGDEEINKFMLLLIQKQS